MTRVFGINGAVLGVVLALFLAPFFFNPIAIAYGLPFVLIGLALFLKKYRIQFNPGFWRHFLRDETGTVAVAYYIQGAGVLINGSATAPTAQQAQQVVMQKAVISMADTDTQALFTHNWGLATSDPTYFNPEIFYYAQLTNSGGTSLTGLTFDVTNTNVVKVNKVNFLGTGGSFVVTLRRPHSIGQ